jgi:hypothetical protein
MPQTSYSLDHAAAIAGQLVDRGDGSRMRGRYVASEALNFGRILELHTDGKLRHPATAGAAGKLMGGCAYNASLPPTAAGVYGYQADDVVPVLRKGQMWVEYTGTAPTVEKKASVMSSSTVATHRGKVTGDAENATAGTEIYGLEGAHVVKVDTALSLALVEFNLPA